MKKQITASRSQLSILRQVWQYLFSWDHSRITLLRLMRTLACLSLLLIVSGCAVPLATPQADADAKSFRPRPEMARIYVYRDTAMGTGKLYDVVIDGEYLAATSPHTFVAKDVRPGEHTVTSETDTTQGLARIHADVGQCYFVRQQPHFANADDEPGKKAVLRCKLAAHQAPREPQPTISVTASDGRTGTGRAEWHDFLR